MEGGTEALEWSKKKGGYHLKWGYSKWTCTNLYLLESVFRVSALRPAGKNGERKGRKLSFFFGERNGWPEEEAKAMAPQTHELVDAVVTILGGSTGATTASGGM